MGNKRYSFGVGDVIIKTIGGVPRSFKMGTIQDFELNMDGDLKELFGQGEFAEDVARGDIKASGKLNFGQEMPELQNAIFLATTENSTGNKVVVGDIPIAIATTITIPNFIEDLGVIWATGDNASLELKRVSSAPAQGEYSIDESTGEYTFNATDVTEAESLFISYSETATDVKAYNFGDKKAGQAPKFQLFYTGEYDGNKVSLKLNACVAGGISPIKAKRAEHQIFELSFNFGKDDTRSVGSLVYSKE